MRDGVMGTSPLSLSLQDLLRNGEADTSWYGMCVYSLGLVRYIGQGELKEKRDGCKKKSAGRSHWNHHTVCILLVLQAQSISFVL